MTDLPKAEPRRPALARNPSFLILLAAVTGTMAYAMQLLARHTIAVVEARGLLPRWDLATHLIHGWVDYHLLATGRILRLLEDLWLQGYWPPVLSLVQVPFYLVLGDGMASGLWSGPTAFVLIGVLGSALLWREWREAAVLPACLFVALLISSPFLMAYASVTMTETVGALAQLVVLFCYAQYQHTPSSKTARLFAVSLTLLFFTKYNYFLLLAGPLVLYEWLAHTAGWGTARRLAMLWRWMRRALSSYTGALLVLYCVAVLVITRTGGFEFHVFAQRVSVRSIGNSGHIVLYLLLARLWYSHRRGRIDWNRLASADLRVRPLLIWFLVPVTIWFASPYPNHIRDFVNLVLNHPMGEPGLEAGLATYLDALRSAYFFKGWILTIVVLLFGVAAVSYRRQPAVMRWLILAIPLQFAAIALHHTRFTRFLLLTVVLLCLVASSEVGRWLAGTRRTRAAAVVGLLVLASGIAAARTVVTEERFLAVAFEHYTDSASLRQALRAIRTGLEGEDRLAIVGHSNELSPALFRWELGRPAGVPCFPSEIGGARRLDLSLATNVLLLVPLGSEADVLNATTYYAAQRQAVLERVERGEFVLRREFPLGDIGVALLLYDRPTAPERIADCR